MLSEILKIQPKLDNNELAGMERNLSQRFTKIAKGFGRGLKLAAVASLGAAVLNKLINPLNEIKAAIDRTLGKADDIVTNAKQFETSTENLLKIRSLFGARGVSSETVDLLITKFQGAVAQAKQNPNDPNVSSVKNFINDKDIGLAFFKYFTGLQKLDPTQRTLAQNQTFGEKLTLKMAESLQDVDFKQTAEALKNIDFTKTAAAAEKLAKFEDVLSAKRTETSAKDLIAKAAVIDKNTINNVVTSERSALKRENGQIARSASAFTAEERIADIQDNLEKLTSQLITNVPEIMDGLKGITTLLGKAVDGWTLIFKGMRSLPFFKGIKPFGGKEE